MTNLALQLVALVAFCSYAAARKGYLLTSPRELKAGGSAKMCLTLTDVDSTLSLTMEFQEKDNTTINSMVYTFPNGVGKCVEHDVPSKLAGKRIQLYVRGEAGDYVFENRKWIQVRTQNPLLTFVQTDKPMYKPGQLVQFRVLSLNHDLTPIEQTISKVFIQDPKGTRIMQWKNITTEKGLASFKLPLSKEPPQGQWKITVELMPGNSSEQKFTVKEYVLPKFEVKINSPSYVYINDEVIFVEICAKYTYGKPVKGVAEVVTKAKTTGYNYGGPRPVLRNRLDINGCGKMVVNGSSLRLKSNRFPIWDASIFFDAVVKEEGTGVSMKGSGSSKIHRQSYEIDISSYTDKYFKPELPLRTKGLVTYPDGRPAPNVNIKVEVTSYQPSVQYKRFVRSNDEGFFHFTFPPMKRDVTEFNIYASAPENARDDCKECYKMITTRTNLQVKQLYSPSGSAMQITNDVMNEEIDCNSDYQVNIQYLTDNPSKYTFNYEVMARGNIVSRGSVEQEFKKRTTIWSIFGRRRRAADNDGVDESPSTELPRSILSPREEDFMPLTKRPRPTTTPLPTITPPEFIHSFTMPVRILPEMAPVARLLVYYIRDDGETVADSVELNIKKCFANKVGLAFERDRYQPGEDAKIMMRAAPDSLCNLGVVDKSVHLLDKSNQLNPSKVFSALAAFDVEPERYSYRDEYCEKEVGPIPMPWDDEIQPLVLERKKRSIIWPTASSKFVDASAAFKDTGLIYLTDLDVDTRPCERPGPWDRQPVDSSGGGGFRRRGPVAVAVEFESAVDDNDNSVEGGKKEDKIRSYFPETWLWKLQSTGSTGEVTLIKKVPDTITEWVGAAFCTNSDVGFGVAPTAYMTVFQPFFASFTLPYSVIRGEIVPVVVTVFNYLSECMVINLTLTKTADFDLGIGSDVQQVCVCGDESKSATFKITPKTLASINITVTAESNPNSLVCGNSVSLSPLVARDAVIRPLLVEPEGAKDEYTFSTLVCPSNDNGSVFSETITLPLPTTLIPGSARGFVSVIGDIMGPTLDGLDELLRLPTGCGEQNMLNFAPNIFVMQYLEATRQITAPIKTKATDFMLTGYQRELTYRHDDGSYSAFGNSDPSGSTWLTSFVVKSFSEARPYITIDQEDVDKSLEWLRSLQGDDGCFRSVGKVLHKGMKGGLADGKSPVAITAYVLIAMLEAGEPSTSESVELARECLEANQVTDTYAITLIAYAYSLLDPADPQTSLAMRKLEDAAINDDQGLTHWERITEIPPDPVSGWQSPYKRASSVNVEMTAYALMALINRSGKMNIASLIPIVQWLTKQRNANGGFSSTQDTVVALQALAKYASLAYSDGIDMTVEVSGQEIDENFMVNDGNSLLLQKRSMTVPNDLTIKARGTGCALMQANVRFNVEVSLPPVPAFDVTVRVVRIRKGNHCKKRLMDICVKYSLDDGPSNMAVVEIQMVSGWIPVKESITALKARQSDLNLKRIEVEKNMVNLYFDQFDDQHECFLMEIVQDIEVENPKPGLITVYDYYETENSVLHAYAIRPYCGTKEELPFNPVQPDDGQGDMVQRRLPDPVLDLGGNPGPRGSDGAGLAFGADRLNQVVATPPEPDSRDSAGGDDGDNEVDVQAEPEPTIPDNKDNDVDDGMTAEPPVPQDKDDDDDDEGVTPEPPVPQDKDDDDEVEDGDATPEPTTGMPQDKDDDDDDEGMMGGGDSDEVPTTEPAGPEPTEEYDIDDDEMDAMTTRPLATSTPLPRTSAKPQELEPGCPMCPTTQPADFLSQICSYDKVLKVNYKGSNSTYPLKLMADMRPDTGKVIMNAFARYRMTSGCGCSAFSSGAPNSKFLILLNDVQLKMMNARRGTLTMQDDTIVLPLTDDLERLVFQRIIRQRACSRQV